MRRSVCSPRRSITDPKTTVLSQLTGRMLPQVWFQNRRQRAKAKDPPRVALSSSDQIMDALFEFSDSMPADARARMALNAICNKVQSPGGPEKDATVSARSAGAQPSAAKSRSDRGSGYSAAEDTLPLAPELGGSRGIAHGGSGLPHNMSFDWALPSAGAGSFPSCTGAQSGLNLEEKCAGVPASSQQPFTTLAALKAPSPPPPPMVLEAMMGFTCHVLKLDAMDYSTVYPGSNGSANPVLLQSYAPEGTSVLNALAWARSMLATPVIDAVASAREATWFGATREQRDMLSRAGNGVQSIIGVPCLELPGVWDAFGIATKAADGPVVGVLLLYSATPLEDTPQVRFLLSVLGSAISAATLGAPAMRPHAPDISYSLHPRQSRSSALGWLLLVAARVIHADIAEHWRAETGPAGVVMTAERLLVSTSVPPNTTVLETGASSEGVHQFSSQMCRASLYAGKVVWCNATHPSGVLEGVALPIKTAIGLPIACAGSSHADALVLYSLRRLEQCQLATNLLMHLQLLLGSSEAQGCQHASRSWAGGVSAPAPPLERETSSVQVKGGLLASDHRAASMARQKRALSIPTGLDMLRYGDEELMGLPPLEVAPVGSRSMDASCSRPAFPFSNKRTEHTCLGGALGLGDLGGASSPALADFDESAPPFMPRTSFGSGGDASEDVATWDQLSTDQMLDLINRCLEEEETAEGILQPDDLDIVESLELAAEAAPQGVVDAGLLKRNLSAQRLIHDQSVDLSRETLVALRDRLGGAPPQAPSSGMGVGASVPLGSVPAGTAVKASAPPIPARVRRPVLSGIPMQRSGCSEGLDSLEL